MTVWKILGVIVITALLLSFLRLSATVRFGKTLMVCVQIGPVKRTVYPKPQKRQKKKDEPDDGEKPSTDRARKKKKQLPKLTASELFDLLHVSLAALKKTAWRVCRRLRVDPLELTLVFGGSDPAGIAEQYGMANALLWTFMPKAEELFYIPDPSVHLRMDFDAPKTQAHGTVAGSLRLCDLIAIAFTLLIPLAKWFVRYKRAHKGERIRKKTTQAGSAEKAPAEKQANNLSA